MNQRDEWMVGAANRENAMQLQIGSTGARDLSIDLCRTESPSGYSLRLFPLVSFIPAARHRLFYYLFLRRIGQQIHISRGGFVLGQIRKNGHPAAVRRWRRTHDDRCAARHLSHKVRWAHTRRQD